MKKIIMTLIVTLTMASFAQGQVKVNENTHTDNIQGKQNNDISIYKLFPTQNMWNFIKLNTRNGQMWQVQYAVSGGNRLEVNLNLESLVTKEKEANGRFTLYPTQNMYNFLLLDQLEGRVWQVQWSTEAEKRVIIPIE